MRHGLICTALLGFVCALTVSPALGREIGKAEDFQDKAHDHYREGDFNSSLSMLGKSLSQYSGFLPSYALRAQVRHALGDEEGSQRDIKQALHIANPKKPELLTLRGDVRLLNGDIADAEKDFTDALELDKEYADAHMGLGRVHRARGDNEEAHRAFRLALKFDPNLYLARYDLARAYFDMGASDNAIREATRALRGNPSFALPYNLLGMIFSQRGDFDRALKAYSKAIRLMPTFTYAYIGRGLAYIKAGKNQLGLNDLKQAVDSGGGDYAPLYNRGEVFLRMGRETEAFEDFKKTLSMGIAHPPAAFGMGKRFMEALKLDEAAEMFTKTLSAIKDHPDKRMQAWTESALLHRAAAYESLKRYTKSLTDLDAAVSVSSNSTLAWTSRGRMHHRMSNDGPALRDFDQALAIDEEYAPALLARGNVHTRARKYAPALKDYTAAIESDPSLSEAYNNRGILYADSFSEFDRAVEDLEKAVSLEEGNPGYRLNLGIVSFKRKDYLRAIEALKKAEEMRAPKRNILLYRAKAHNSLGKTDEAHADIDEAIRLSPDMTELYTAKAGFYVESLQYQEAIKVIKFAIKLDKKNDLAYLYRGLAYGAMGEYSRASRDFRESAQWAEKPSPALTLLCQSERLNDRARRAVEECEKALQYDPEFGPAYIQRGLAFLDLKDYPKAIRDLDDGVRLTPARAEVYLARSIAHVPMKQYRESDEAYRKAMALDDRARFADLTMGEQPKPTWDYQTRIDSFRRQLDKDGDNPYTNLVTGNALHNAGYFDRAILEYTRAMEINGRLTAAYLDRGASLSAQESLDAAEFDHRRAVELSPNDPETHIGLVTLLTARKKYSDGLKTVIAALGKQADNPNPETFVKAGNLRYFLKDVKRAIVNFKLALKFDPYHAAAYNGLGLCFFAQRQYPEALENFSRAVALEPHNDRYRRNRASTFVNLKDFGNAASDYRHALKINKDPEMVDNYQNLIRNSEQMIKKAVAQDAPTAKRAATSP